MESADTDAAGCTAPADTNLNIKAGLITGETFNAGVYECGSDIYFRDTIYIKAPPPTSSSLSLPAMSSWAPVRGSFSRAVSGPPNVVWQVAGYVAVGTTAHVEGIFLVKTHAAFKTGSSLNGRILGAQTAVTLDHATITQPARRPSLQDAANPLDRTPLELQLMSIMLLLST